METWKHLYIVSTHNWLQYITELTSFCLEYIYIHHPRIFLHSIHHAWCLWVKMKLVSDDWLKGGGGWVTFLSNGNTQVNKISGDIFNSTDISPSDLPTHPHRQYNDLSTDSNSRKWLFCRTFFLQHRYISPRPTHTPTHPDNTMISRQTLDNHIQTALNVKKTSVCSCRLFVYYEAIDQVLIDQLPFTAMHACKSCHHLKENRIFWPSAKWPYLLKNLFF